MKRWTVILIPHDRGQRRSFNMSDLHIWGLVSLVVILCGASGFFYNRSQSYQTRSHDLQEQNKQLEAGLENRVLPENLEDFLAEKESEIRTHYETRDQTLTDELSRLYDLEREVRIISGTPAISDGKTGQTDTNGQGGTPGDPDQGDTFAEDPRMNPPALLLGLQNPSADLILEEMALRTRSLTSLLGDLEALRHRLAHTPTDWPTADDRRRVNSRFGTRKDPFTGQQRHHSGVDIRATYGSPIFATADGVVIFSGYHQFLGHVVKVDHGYGFQTWYGHMSERLAKKGDAVLRGSVIGKVGSTGRSTGPHIHYEVHVNDQRVDPRNYIGR